MKKKLFKVMFIIMIAIVMTSATNIVLAEDAATGGFTYPTATTPGAIGTVASDTVNIIYTVVQTVGISIAAIMLIVLAIKYISAAPGEKATIKKQSIVYVTGAVILFASAGIIQLIKAYATGL